MHRTPNPSVPADAAPRNGLVPVASALVGASVVVAIAGDTAAAALRYERAAVLGGQAWRLVTAHLVHLGPVHLALNAAGLALVTVLLGPLWRARAWAAIALACALGVTLGLLAASPRIAWYVGLSGVAHGFVAAGAARLLRSQPAAGAAWLAGLAGKLAWEQWHGGVAASAWLGGATVVDAHLHGALAGLAAALLCTLLPRASRF